MWSKYYRQERSEFEYYLQQGVDLKARKNLLEELTVAICNVEMKEEKPTVDHRVFQREMENGYQAQEHDQLCLFNSHDVVKHDVHLAPSENVETNHALPSIDQRFTGYDNENVCIESPLSYDDLLKVDWLGIENDLGLHIQPEVCNQYSLQHKGNDYAINNKGLNVYNQHEHFVSSPGSPTQNESSEEESNYFPSSPGDDVVQTKKFGSKKSALLNPKKRRKSEDMREPTMLWEFILMMLMMPGQRDCVRWSNEDSGEFIIKDSKMLAASWGMHKCKQPTTYENLSRSLRYYYGENILEKVKHRRLMYRFIKREQYMTSKRKYFNQSYLQKGDKF